jgi:hypothetical protein
LFKSSFMLKTPMFFDVLACPVSPEIGLIYVCIIAVPKPHFLSKPQCFWRCFDVPEPCR